MNAPEQQQHPLQADDILSDDSQEEQDPDLVVELSPHSPPVPRVLRREPPNQRVAHIGGKRPRYDMHTWRDHHAVSVESDDEDNLDEVDMKAFFKRHRVPPKEQVLICRSYASYMAAKIKTRKHNEEK